MTPGQRAEALIASFGITDPRDLDVEAIARACDMKVEFHPLTGCEATLAGFGNKAIATVKPSPVKGRVRFSIGHELGHWKLHRGRSFRCRIDDPDDNLASNRVEEKEADTFAAHLLMPAPLFNPKVNALVKPGFRALEGLAAEFEASLLATAIRVADVNKLPVVLACYSASGLRWFKASEDVPRRWWLTKTLDDDSFAYDLVTQGKLRTGLGKQPAEVWFTNDDADRYELFEDCIPGKNGEVYVLLYLEADMMEAGFDRNVGPQYGKYGSYASRGTK